MSYIKRGTIERIIKLFNCASKDETRLHITGVNICASDDGIILQGCDGYIMGRYLVSDDGLKEILGGKSIIIAPDSLGTLKGLLKSNKHITEFGIYWYNESLRIGDYPIVLINRDYPRTDHLIPSVDGCFELAFDAELLMRLAKSMVQSKKSDGKIRLFINTEDKKSPIVIKSFEQSDFNVGVLMPLKI